MPKKRWILASTCLWLCGASWGFAATGNAHFNVRAWTTDDGLPQSSVIAMTRTRDGYLWLGTLNGLVRFDGIRFTTFDQNNTPGLNGGGIVHLFEDSRDGLWIISEDGSVAMVKDGRVVSESTVSRSSEHGLTGACEDSTGAVWLFTGNGQLMRFPRNRGSEESIGTNYFSNCRAIMAEKNGLVRVAAANGLFTMDPVAFQKVAEPPKQRIDSVTNVDFLLTSQHGGFWCLADGKIQKSLSNRIDRAWLYPWKQKITSACEDFDGNLIVGTYGDGVYWFDADGKYTRISSEEGLTHESILSLAIDGENCLWVGTDGGGLNRVKRSLFDVWPGTEGKTVQSVCEDAHDGLWVGFNGGGPDGAINYWKDGVRQSWGTNQDLYVRSVFVDRDQNVWIGTQGPWLPKWGPGLFQLRGGEARLDAGPAPIWSIFQDRRGLLWVGSEFGLLSRKQKLYGTSDGLSSDDVRAIADDADGNLWIGTALGGLNCLRDGKISSMRGPDGPLGDVTALLVDNEGVLWIGTRGRGLERFHGGKWTRYTTDQGLVGNYISYLLDDGQGFLWIGSNHGLMRVAKKALNDFAEGSAKSIPGRTYGKPDGLPTGECTFDSQPAALRARNGKLFFCTTKGLAMLDPSRLAPNTNPPLVNIESVLVGGVEQNTNGLRAKSLDSIVIPPGRERLDIQFTSLNLAAPERTRFKYRLDLEGEQTDWTEVGRSEAGNIPTARYSRLQPGNYRFQVTACNEDGFWNETGASLAITVLPPFWRTWPFLGVTALCLLGIIVAAVHYVSFQNLQRQLEGFRQQQALEKERARIARDIHDQLGASLTQVSLLGEMVEVDKDSPQEVETHARQISQTARETTRALDEIVWTVNPSNDTLDGLITYVCKYAQDYLAVAGLRYRLDIPPQLPEAVISPEVRHNVFLAAKESVTNVVRHAHATAAWIRLRLDPGSFILEIEDNGRGIPNPEEKKAKSRNGLHNMRKRMEDVGGAFAIMSGAEGGTLIQLIVPLKPR